MSNGTRAVVAVGMLVVAAACKKDEKPVAYQAVPVERRDIVVSAQASGAIEPDTLVEVKSKASGEILGLLAETGQQVKRGDPLVRIDPRTARNAVATAQAQLDVARAKLANAAAQKTRSDELFKSASITQQEHETAQLDHANANSDVVTARVALENARIQLEDVVVKAPISGTIISKNVERGNVIASALSNVQGGTVLLRMADLGLVQVRTLVDETDIGKIQPGMPATVTVDAYPNRPFEGSVLKIEPQADTAQNVTRFPVRVRIQNRDNLLRPGMNTEVQIHVGRRDSVLAVPTAALRTQRDVASAAQVVGVTMEQVQKELAAGGNTAGGDAAGGAAAGRGGRASLGATTPTDSAGNGAKAGNTMTTPDGRTIPLPEGVTEAQVRAIFQKRMSGGELTADEQATLTKVRQAMGRGGAAAGGGRARGGSEFQFGGNYIAFVRRNGAVHAVNVRTGLTDLDYSEVRSGLQPGDSVLMLPSASLMQSQTEMKQRINSITGGGMPGMRQQTPSSGGGR